MILFALLEVKWFYLPSDTSSILVKYNYDGKNMAIVVVAIVITVFQILLFNNKKIKFMFKTHVFIIWALWLVSYSYAVFYYNQDELYTFNQFIYFGIYILYFSLQWYFESTGNYEAFCTLFSFCTALFSILICFQAFLWQNGGDYYLTILEYLERDVITRNQMIRIMAPSALISFCSVISFSKLFQFKKRKKAAVIIDIINVASGTVYIFYACGTRALMLIQILIYGIVFICMRKRNNLLRTILLFAAAAVLLYYTFTNNVFQYLNYETTEHSYQYRLGAFGYFLEQGLLNPFCGLGFLTDHAPQYADLLHGPQGVYYISDVGICGFAGQMGIIAAIVYLFIVIRIWKICIGIKKAKGYFNTVVLGIACFTTFTLVTISLQTNYTIITMVLSMVYAEYEYRTFERNCSLSNELRKEGIRAL